MDNGAGTEGASVRSEPARSVVGKSARSKSAVGLAAAPPRERDAERKAKKAEYARNRYWAKKGKSPPQGDGRARSPPGELPNSSEQALDDESDDDAVGPDSLDEDASIPVAEAPRTVRDPPRRLGRSRESPKGGGVVGGRKNPPPRVADAGGSWSLRILVGGALIAAGIWMHSRSGASASNATPAPSNPVSQGAPTQDVATGFLPQLTREESDQTPIQT